VAGGILCGIFILLHKRHAAASPLPKRKNVAEGESPITRQLSTQKELEQSPDEQAVSEIVGWIQHETYCLNILEQPFPKGSPPRPENSGTPVTGISSALDCFRGEKTKSLSHGVTFSNQKPGA
jgi:hypothetical protein